MPEQSGKAEWSPTRKLTPEEIAEIRNQPKVADSGSPRTAVLKEGDLNPTLGRQEDHPAAINPDKPKAAELSPTLLSEEILPMDEAEQKLARLIEGDHPAAMNKAAELSPTLLSEEILPMDEVDKAKQKLARLEELMSCVPDSPFYDFGRHLASYLNLQLSPMNFVMACDMALDDLRTGVNGFTGERIQSRFVGYPPKFYSILRTGIPSIARAVFPAEFAASVEKCM
jgi:hypothetical protein